MVGVYLEHFWSFVQQPKNRLELIRSQKASEPASSAEELKSILAALKQFKTTEPLKVEDAIKWVQAVSERDGQHRVIVIAERLTYLLIAIVPPAFVLLLIDGQLGILLPPTLRLILQSIGYGGITTAASGGLVIGARAIWTRWLRKETQP